MATATVYEPLLAGRGCRPAGCGATRAANDYFVGVNECHLHPGTRWARTGLNLTRVAL